MGTVAALLAVKLLTLSGSIATTAWLVSFFAFEDALGAHRWTLFVGGFAAIAAGELGAWLIARQAGGRQPAARR
ncbi:hypothetical protein ACFQ4O_09970 [Methylopila musalis]|uniref:Uncharacterized protein n=1 Tax=Methylopila musalis TaxID=1134781 RepID=A0ABW3Z7S1_9HYPH